MQLKLFDGGENGIERMMPEKNWMTSALIKGDEK